MADQRIRPQTPDYNIEVLIYAKKSRVLLSFKSEEEAISYHDTEPPTGISRLGRVVRLELTNTTQILIPTDAGDDGRGRGQRDLGICFSRDRHAQDWLRTTRLYHCFEKTQRTIWLHHIEGLRDAAGHHRLAADIAGQQQQPANDAAGNEQPQPQPQPDVPVENGDGNNPRRPHDPNDRDGRHHRHDHNAAPHATPGNTNTVHQGPLPAATQRPQSPRRRRNGRMKNSSRESFGRAVRKLIQKALEVK